MTIELSDTQRELGGMVVRLMRDKYDFIARQGFRQADHQLTSDIWTESILPKMSLYYKWSAHSDYAYANVPFYNAIYHPHSCHDTIA